MPTYDYKCGACEHQFEVFQSITAPPLKKCPKCKKSKVRRLIGTGAALLFKGDGFYITDYRSEGYKKSAEAESGAGKAKSEPATADAKPADSKSADSKPAPKSEPAATKSEPQKPTGSAGGRKKSK